MVESGAGGGLTESPVEAELGGEDIDTVGTLKNRQKIELTMIVYSIITTHSRAMDWGPTQRATTTHPQGLHLPLLPRLHPNQSPTLTSLQQLLLIAVLPRWLLGLLILFVQCPNGSLKWSPPGLQ